jgi:hypothetical protein
MVLTVSAAHAAKVIGDSYEVVDGLAVTRLDNIWRHVQTLQ